MFNQISREVIILIMSFGGLLMLFAAFIVFIVYYHQKKQFANAMILDELKINYEAALFQSQIEIQEQTLRHIAAEIHDNVGQQLTLAKLNLNSLSQSLQPEFSINKTIEILTQSIQTLSDLSRNMGTQLLQDNGLISAIEADIQKLNASKQYTAHLHVMGEEKLLNANTELLLYRIVQECINNFIKHAQAKQINISLTFASHLLLQVEDDGVGFDPVQKNHGSGLGNIKNRVNLLKGHLEIISQPGKSTAIIINIPIYEQHR